MRLYFNTGLVES